MWYRENIAVDVVPTGLPSAPLFAETPGEATLSDDDPALSVTASQPGGAGRAFLQRRVSKFGLAMAALLSFSLVFRTLVALSNGSFDAVIRHPTFALHGLMVSIWASLWLVCRVGTHSARFTRVAEVLALWSAALSFAALGAFIDPVKSPGLVVFTGTCLCLFVRSVFVPSTATRTVLTGAGVAIVSEVVNYAHQVRAFDPATWASLDPAVTGGSATTFAANEVLSDLLWWTCGIAVCAMASQIVYGLRREARDSRRLGQYTLEKRIGEGGMGVVYRASHALLRRPTAVKLVRAEQAAAVTIERFEREVQLTSILRHANTVTVFDYGRTYEGVFYYAMEYLDGITLLQLVQALGPQPPARVVHILQQAAGALAEAHRIGLIHRDIKPANIMLVEQGGVLDFAKVLDFGLVKDISPDSEHSSLTRIDGVNGTPHYMSPEAIGDPDSLDHRSDLYALGAVAYYLLTGRHVFSGSTILQICTQQLTAEPTPPSAHVESPIPEELDALILQCLAKDREDRPRDAETLRRALLDLPMPRWTESDAQAWWATHAGHVERAQSDAPSAPDLTFKVDMAHRHGLR